MQCYFLIENQLYFPENSKLIPPGFPRRRCKEVVVEVVKRRATVAHSASEIFFFFFKQHIFQIIALCHKKSLCFSLSPTTQCHSGSQRNSSNAIDGNSLQLPCQSVPMSLGILVRQLISPSTYLEPRTRTTSWTVLQSGHCHQDQLYANATNIW